MNLRRDNFPRALAALALLSLGLRLAMAAWRPPDAAQAFSALNDSGDYHLLARSLLAHGGWLGPEGLPSLQRPPAYPLFLAAVYAIAGVGNLMAVAVAQAFLGAVHTVLVALVARRAGLVPLAALAAAAIDAAYPVFVFQSSLVLGEALHRPLQSGALLLVLAAAGRGNPALAVAAGFATAAAALSKPVLLATLPLWGALAWASASSSRRSVALGWAAGAAILLGAWTARNAAATGRFVAVGTNFPITMAHGASPYCLYAAKWYGADRLLPLPPDFLLQTQLRTFAGPAEELAAADKWSRAAWGFAAENPAFFARLSLRKALHFWSPLIENPSRSARWAALLSMGFVLAAGWAGVALALRESGDVRAVAAFSLLFAGAVTVPYALSMPDIRYRTPLVDPLWIVWAGYGCERFFRWARARRRSPQGSSGCTA